MMMVVLLLIALLLSGPATADVLGEEAGLQLIKERCGTCHGVTLHKQCLTGPCESGQVHPITQRPWEIVVPWMKAMGCQMSGAEQATMTDYLMRHYGKSYPVRWERAGTVAGGWNVVSLASFRGQLYAGIEGNGSIVRLTEGPAQLDPFKWTEVLTTPNYTVYGLTPFHGTLYAGTNDPAAEIWSSGDGGSWRRTGRLEGEKGITSLGVFKGMLYVGTTRTNIYRSEDGITWIKTEQLRSDAPSSFSNWVRFLLPFHGALYAGIERGGLFQTDDGISWHPVWPPDDQKGVRGVAIFRESLYVGTTARGEIWRLSSEPGGRWTRVFLSDPATARGYVGALSVLGDVLYAAVGGSVFGSRDGLQWEELGQLGPYTLEAMTAYDGQLYVGTTLPPNAWLYRTTGMAALKGE